MDDNQFKLNCLVENHKLLLTLLMLLATLGWGLFCVYITVEAIAKLRVTDIIVAAGANGLMGVLGTLLTLTWQFHFRKAKPE